MELNNQFPKPMIMKIQMIHPPLTIQTPLQVTVLAIIKLQLIQDQQVLLVKIYNKIKLFIYFIFINKNSWF
jgi:hypothetical protein